MVERQPETEYLELVEPQPCRKRPLPQPNATGRGPGSPSLVGYDAM